MDLQYSRITVGTQSVSIKNNRFTPRVQNSFLLLCKSPLLLFRVLWLSSRVPAIPSSTLRSTIPGLDLSHLDWQGTHRTTPSIDARCMGITAEQSIHIFPSELALLLFRFEWTLLAFLECISLYCWAYDCAFFSSGLNALPFPDRSLSKRRSSPELACSGCSTRSLICWLVSFIYRIGQLFSPIFSKVSLSSFGHLNFSAARFLSEKIGNIKINSLPLAFVVR